MAGDGGLLWVIRASDILDCGLVTSLLPSSLLTLCRPRGAGILAICERALVGGLLGRSATGSIIFGTSLTLVIFASTIGTGAVFVLEAGSTEDAFARG